MRPEVGGGRGPGSAEVGGARSDGGRRAILRRKTRETEVLVDLDLDPTGAPGPESDGGAPAPGAGDRGRSVGIDTGIGFLDHLVGSLAHHAGWRLELRCVGDLPVDDHHSVEDCALLLGEALARALAGGAAAGAAPRRFGHAYAPLDEALSRAVVDLSGRPSATIDLGPCTGRIGALEEENIAHFLVSLAMAARMTLHVDVLRGDNSHHRAESAFKALALALRVACAVEPPRPGDGRREDRSTKGGVLLEELDRKAFEAAARRLTGSVAPPVRSEAGKPREAGA